MTGKRYGAENQVITIYHNPACGTSRNVLGLLQQAGAEPRVVEYLATPPSREVIADLAARIGLPLRAILRRKDTPYSRLGLDDHALGAQQLLDAVVAHPILLNRPIVVSPHGARLCRPSDVVLDLLPQAPARRLLKEDGVPFLRDMEVSPDDAGLRTALAGAGLPVDDLAGPDRTFFAYATLDGDIVGHGGFERHGEAVLVRSVTVMPGARRTGLGSGLVPLLLFRAYAGGARRAYLLTTIAAPFFAGLGFRAIARQEAPAAILATRQASALCPANATLMTRTLGF